MKEQIEGILQKHGVATKMVVTSNEPEMMYTQEVATELIGELTNLLTQQREEAVKTTFEEIGDGMVRAYRGCECCGVATFTVHTKEELDILSQQREKGNKFKQEE